MESLGSILLIVVVLFGDLYLDGRYLQRLVQTGLPNQAVKPSFPLLKSINIIHIHIRIFVGKGPE